MSVKHLSIMKIIESYKKGTIRSDNKRNSNLKLINSAIRSISERGINETTMLNVSKGAGLSHGIVNFHFKSKELLLIETLKFISNEYLEEFQKKLQKAKEDPEKKIIAIINNDFDQNICNRDKVAVWYTFFSEVKFKPVYLQICKERDEYYNQVAESIMQELIDREKNKNLSAKQLATSLSALTLGLWLDQLVDSENFKRNDAKKICFDFIKINFPKQFKRF